MTRLILSAAAAANVSAAALATPPFELIVPTSVRIYSQSGDLGFVINGWGWLGATRGTLTQAQIENALLIHGFRSTDLPETEFVIQPQDFDNEQDLSPGQWQGVGNTETEPLYESLLSPSEIAARIGEQSLRFFCHIQSQAIGSGDLQTDILIGTQRLTYYTHISIEPGPLGNVVMGAQRIGSLSYVCPCDFDDSGSVNSQDFFDYVSCFFTGCSRADFNRFGGVNSQDFFDFLACFFDPPAGC